MTKKELVFIIAKELDMTQVSIAKVLETALSAISHTLDKNEAVTLKGFGSFRLKKKKSCFKKIPGTKEKILVPSEEFVKFKPSLNIRNYSHKK